MVQIWRLGYLSESMLLSGMGDLNKERVQVKHYQNGQLDISDVRKNMGNETTSGQPFING
jgi:hypothetical protein